MWNKYTQMTLQITVVDLATHFPGCFRGIPGAILINQPFKPTRWDQEKHSKVQCSKISTRVFYPCLSTLYFFFVFFFLRHFFAPDLDNERLRAHIATVVWPRPLFAGF